MITIYKIIEKIRKDRECLQKILIGGLLMFIPIVNIFAIGYLYRYARQIVKTRKMSLPAWDAWGKLFIDGLIFLGITVVFGVLPLLIGWVLSEGVRLITFDYLRWFPLFPVSIAIVVAPSLVLLGAFSLLKGEGIRGLFTNTVNYFRLFLKFWLPLTIGNVAYVGFCIIGLPLYGFVYFIGLLLLIPYTWFVLKQTDNLED